MSIRHSPVVVGYDFSHTGHAALTRAVTLAGGAPHHVLHVVCVVDPRAPIPSLDSYNGVDYMYTARVQEALAAAIGEELARLDVATRLHFFVHARIGKPAPEILGLAREVGADLIIIGSHGLTGVERLLVGSTAERIVREAGCTVEVARPKQYAEVELVSGVPGPGAVAPHHYEYEDHQVRLRPVEWPLH